MERHTRGTRTANRVRHPSKEQLGGLLACCRDALIFRECSDQRKPQAAKKFPSSNGRTPWAGHPAETPVMRIQLLGNESGLLHASTKGDRKQKHMLHQKQTHSRAQKEPYGNYF